MDSALEAEFGRFMEMIGLQVCHETQRTEMKRAFMAGAYTALTNIPPIGILPNQSVELMKRECVAFKNRVVGGQA